MTTEFDNSELLVFLIFFAIIDRIINSHFCSCVDFEECNLFYKFFLFYFGNGTKAIVEPGDLNFYSIKYIARNWRGIEYFVELDGVMNLDRNAASYFMQNEVLICTFFYNPFSITRITMQCDEFYTRIPCCWAITILAIQTITVLLTCAVIARKFLTFTHWIIFIVGWICFDRMLLCGRTASFREITVDERWMSEFGRQKVWKAMKSNLQIPLEICKLIFYFADTRMYAEYYKVTEPWLQTGI